MADPVGDPATQAEYDQAFQEILVSQFMNTVQQAIAAVSKAMSDAQK